jgi:hypothetical protein
LRQVGGFLWFPQPNKTDRHDITEILSKLVLNTITLSQCTSKYASSSSSNTLQIDINRYKCKSIAMI